MLYSTAMLCSTAPNALQHTMLHDGIPFHSRYVSSRFVLLFVVHVSLHIYLLMVVDVKMLRLE